MKIVACVAEDPLDPRTFGGYIGIFSALAAASNEVVLIATRAIWIEDLFRGAVNIGNTLQWPRKRPRVDPNWYWSRKSFELISEHFSRKLCKVPGAKVIIQVGSHTVSRNSALPFYCVTDTTIRQATEAGEFSISTTRPPVIKEAIACQRERLLRCTGIFVLSNWTPEGIVSDYDIPRDTICVIGTGANVPYTVTRRIKTATPSILFVGYDWARKGGPLLLESFRVVKRTLPQAELIIVGCSPPIRDEGVRMVGKPDRRYAADRKRLLELYAQASVFSILPTFDPFPNILLEAALFGLSVVSIDNGSRCEAITDGTTGFLAKSRDPNEIAGLFIRLLTDVPLMNSAGNAATRRRAIRQFTWLAVARKVLDETTRRNAELNRMSCHVGYSPRWATL